MRLGVPCRISRISRIHFAEMCIFPILVAPTFPSRSEKNEPTFGNSDIYLSEFLECL